MHQQHNVPAPTTPQLNSADGRTHRRGPSTPQSPAIYGMASFNNAASASDWDTYLIHPKDLSPTGSLIDSVNCTTSHGFSSRDGAPAAAEPRWLWPAIVAFRVVLAIFCLPSADSPDEWYQSLEVAYVAVFGKGDLTWEWRAGLRSFLYPLPFACAFGFLKATGLDSPWAIFVAPRVIAGLTCAGMDWATYRVAQKYTSPSLTSARVALFLSLTSWYVSFIGLRTLTNSLEGLMLLIAFIPDSFHLFLCCAGLGCGLRATFALPMMPLALYRMYGVLQKDMLRQIDKRDEEQLPITEHGVSSLGDGAKSSSAKADPSVFHGRLLTPMFGRAVARLVGVIVFWIVVWLFIIAVVDYQFYGRWICSPIVFLKFNVFEGLSALFGVHPFWYYFATLPYLLGVPTLILLIGSKAAMATVSGKLGISNATAERHNRYVQLILCVAATLLFAYSALPHKELRFLFPMMPVLHVATAAAWIHSEWLWRMRRWVVYVVLVYAIILSYIMTLGRQKGQTHAVNYIRSALLPPGASTHDHRIHVLGACHVVPGRTHMHEIVTELILNNCSIELSKDRKRLPMEHHVWVHHPLEFVSWIYDGVGPDQVKDEVAALRQRFANSPVHADHMPLEGAEAPDDFTPDADLAAVLKARIPSKGRRLPHRIVIFDSDALWIERWLRQHGYEIEQSFAHYNTPGLFPRGPTEMQVWFRKTTEAAVAVDAPS